MSLQTDCFVCNNKLSLIDHNDDWMKWFCSYCGTTIPIKKEVQDE